MGVEAYIYHKDVGTNGPTYSSILLYLEPQLYLFGYETEMFPICNNLTGELL